VKSLNRQTREILAKRRIDLIKQEGAIAKQRRDIERLIINLQVEELVAKAKTPLHHA
jgi:hypothetical protein